MEQSKKSNTPRTKLKGAGGTNGGITSFLIGLGMMGTGFYLLLSKITLMSQFGMGSRIYHHAGAFGTGMNISVTTGGILIPLILGIGWIFYNSKSMWGWILAGVSLAAMIFGVITNLKIGMKPMNAFDFIMISVLAFGGFGIFLRSLKDFSDAEEK